MGSRCLSETTMDRTIEALKICSEKMEMRRVIHSRLIATEACRVAKNSGDFVERVRDEVGLELEIVSNETEAQLAVSGCASLIDHACDWALVFDIGGGSSELIWLDLANFKRDGRGLVHRRPGIQDCIVAWTSLRLGVVTLAEKYGGHDVTSEVYEAMVKEVMGKLAAFEAQHGLRALIAKGRVQLMGTSGTVTTIAGIHLELPVYDRKFVDGCWMRTDRVREVSWSLIGMSYDERVAQPCIGDERADLVLAGCAILEAVLRTWPCERLRVADRGLREGILANLMAEDGHPHWRRTSRHDRGGENRRPSQR